MRDSDIDELIAGIKSNIKAFCDELLDVMNEETEEASHKAYREFAIFQKRKIKDMFHKAVEDFYGDYSPEFYDRNESLYDILHIRTGMYGMASYDSYEDLYDSSKMTTDRKGGSLFEKVFEQGWHGGAESGDGHPKPGTPYYRTPESVYSRWGRMANRSVAAKDTFEQELSIAEGGEIYREFCAISNRHNSEAMDKVQNMMPALHRKHFGY